MEYWTEQKRKEQSARMTAWWRKRKRARMTLWQKIVDTIKNALRH